MKNNRSILMVFLLMLPSVLFGGNYPIPLEIRNATGATYDVVNSTSTNPLQTIPVEIQNPASMSFSVGTLSVTTGPIPAGTNTIGSIKALVDPVPPGSYTIGSIGAIVNPLPPGTNTIGSVSITSLPNVTVGTLPSTPAGTNVIGSIGAIVGALPTGGNHIGSVDLTDEYGFENENTPMGELRTITPVRLVGAQFEGTSLDANFWTAGVANAATVTQGSAAVTLTSGVNPLGSSQLYSVRRARYVSGSSNQYRAVIQLGDTGTVGNTRIWGIAFGTTMPSVTDGAYFELASSTFSVVTLKDGVATKVTSGAFNGNIGTTYAPGITATTYEIYWTNTKVYFTIGGSVLHTVTASAATWASTMNHHLYLSNINAGNTSSVTLKCRVASIRRLGSLLSQPASAQQTGTVAAKVLKIGPGNLHSVIISGITNNSVVTLYDNTSAAGTVLFTSGAMGAGTSSPNVYSIDLKGLPFFTGLTLAITGANSSVTAVYE